MKIIAKGIGLKVPSEGQRHVAEGHKRQDRKSNPYSANQKTSVALTKLTTATTTTTSTRQKPQRKLRSISAQSFQSIAYFFGIISSYSNTASGQQNANGET